MSFTLSQNNVHMTAGNPEQDIHILQAHVVTSKENVPFTFLVYSSFVLHRSSLVSDCSH